MVSGRLRRHPLWIYAGRPIVVAVPFAFFFFLMNGGSPALLLQYYAVSMVFAVCVNLAVHWTGRWVVPALPHAVTEEGVSAPRLPLQIAAFALASVLGSLAAALLLHVTVMPQMLGSGRAVVQILVFALLFTTLFIAVIYAFRFQRRLVERVRAETERATREEHEMRLAADIQQALLPPRSRSAAWYAAAGASIPCRSIGGDFFEYFELPDGRLGFALADVSGKGPPAALLAAMVQGIFDSHARRGEGPAATIVRVNEALAAREIETRFATVFYGVLGRDGTIVFCNAGHNPPVLLRGGRVVGRLEAGGLVIGPYKDARYEEESTRLERGDLLVAYSDGVTDAEGPDGEQFGEDRLLASLRSPDGASAEAIRDGLLDSVRSFAEGRPPFDDVTVLAVRYLGA
ncbi:MAG: PP2C family protein-serine/threonine phosphatase [Hyphomicrobiales bacterium]